MVERTDKVNSLLEHEISKILLKDFDFSDKGMITLTHVDTTANLIEAKVYISVLPDNRFEDVMRALNREVYFIQKKINRTLRMRPVPKLIFVKDATVAKAGRIEELLHKAKEED